MIIPPCIYDGNKNIFIGPHVYIGPRACLSATKAKIIIEGNVSIGEDLTIHTGNHARQLGYFHNSLCHTNKPSGYDKDVIIEEDVWIGCRVTILMGSTIRRGCTIAAGSVVNKELPPYCMAGGVPARFIKFYWTIEEIMAHESILYEQSKRYTSEQLKSYFDKYTK